MLAFHSFLDHIFKQRISFSIFFRLWLSFALLIIIACGLALYYTQQTLRPSAKRVVEDSLVDTSRLLSALVADELAQRKGAFRSTLNQRLMHTFSDQNSPLWYDQKTQSQLHVYITDKVGRVIYDSKNTQIGADFSRWNDVYLTLQGKYGARSTDINGSSVMYVASPIVYDGQLLGVLSVGKPTHTLIPYISKSTHELTRIILAIMALALLISVLMAWWLRHSIQSINRYTQGLAQHTPPYFYLGKELNELTSNITAMKDTIENKAYVTEYVHTLTHELKSPLTAIKASGELLADELSAKEREQFSHIIKEQTGKLTHLVDSLLTLAKIEQPDFKLKLEPCSPNELIDSCLNQQSAKLAKTRTDVQFYAQQHELMADKFWLSQALQNVIDNAIHYGEHYLLIDMQADNQTLTINIINDSCPLPDFVSQKVFERYFSLGGDKATKGTGLGLTLVKQIIEQHGGNVSFNQLDGKDFANRYPKFGIFDENFVVVSLSLPLG